MQRSGGHGGRGLRSAQRNSARAGSVLGGASRRFDTALERTLRASAVPYGYTVTIWASGAYLISLQGRPNLLEVFGFVTGALLAFAFLAVISERLPESTGGIDAEKTPEPTHPVLAAGLHIAAVGLALGAAAAADGIGDIAWLISPFVATSLYLSAASFELSVAVELAHRDRFRSRAARRARIARTAPPAVAPTEPVAAAPVTVERDSVPVASGSDRA